MKSFKLKALYLDHLLQILPLLLFYMFIYWFSIGIWIRSVFHIIFLYISNYNRNVVN